MIKYAVYKDGKMINYRHPLKVVVNNILRVLQFWTKNKYIFATMFEKEKLTGHRIKKVQHKYYLPVKYDN